MSELKTSGKVRRAGVHEMARLNEEEAQARSLGLAFLDASRIYEDYVIPRYEDRLHRRRTPPYRSAIIGLVGRQRRFLRAAYTLADTAQALEALGPLRSMFEFLVCQRWLARDPDRNWRLWMDRGHAERDVLRARLRERAPVLYDAATDLGSPDQREEAKVIAAVRSRVTAELGDRQPEDRLSLEQRAAQVGLAFFYDLLYRYESGAATHATLLAVDLLLEQGPGGLVLRGEPTAQHARVPVYLHGAHLLYEALKESGEHTSALVLPALPALGSELERLIEHDANARMPNWQELLSSWTPDAG